MYAKSIIETTLHLFKATTGWMPEYHSIEEVDKFNAHLDSLVDVESNTRSSTITFKRDFTLRELRWMENERVLCAFDSNYFETRYCWVCDEENEIFRFSNRKSQEVFDMILADFDEKQVAIEIMALKGRQLGVSTKVALKFLHRLLFIPRTQAIMASVSDEKSELMHRILSTATEKLPWWLPPQVKTHRVGKMIEYLTGSVVSIQSGAQRTGIAQGWTPVLVHVSEAADYPNPKKVLEEGLMRATHSSSKLFAVYEGTGNGNIGWWADLWRTSKELWPKGRSRLFPMFLPWHMAPDLYPLPDWLKKFPIEPGWTPLKETRAHSTKCEAFVRNTPYLTKVLGEAWKLPREQQWYWEFNYQESLRKNTAKIWLSQMPADDNEALQGKNDTVFGAETIEVMQRDRQKKYDVYGIVGEGVDEEHEPNPADVDYSKPRISVKWKSPRGQDYEWMLIPLRYFDENEEQESMGKLLVFEEPVAGEDYSVGVDTADGLGLDRSVASITRNETGEGCDVQVAEFTHDRLNSPQMVGYVACLSAWYGAKARDSRGTKHIIEQRRKPGDDCQLQLKRMGFTYHHRMIYYDNLKVDENRSNKEGWFTNAWSRPLLLGRFVDAIENNWYKVNSPYLVRELMSFERKLTVNGAGKMEHQQGKKDDRIFAAAMSYFTRHALDVMLERSKRRYEAPQGKYPELDLNPYTGFQVGVGEVPW